ncbi:hypothetical protein [Paraburkholderia sp. 32]|uniref:hypothetical protein n=1 Tax=Paraburkholderia sp. 32 TaxID=2991057 RepID=UPI003D23A3E6
MTTIQGVAATGAPLVGATVQAIQASNGAVCLQGTVTGADGSFQLTAQTGQSGCTIPYLLYAQTAQGPLVAAMATGEALPANGAVTMSLTPITTAIYFGTVPVSSTVSSAALAQALTNVSASSFSTTQNNLLQTLQQLYPASTYPGVTWSGFDPYAVFTANHTGIDFAFDNMALTLPLKESVQATSVTTSVTNPATGQAFTITSSDSGGSAGSVAQLQPLSSSVVQNGTTVSYTGINYESEGVLDTVTAVDAGGAPWAGATISDIGTNAVAGTGQQTSLTANGTGGFNWSSPVVAGLTFDQNAGDSNLPAVAMVCESIGGAQISSDVLIPSNAQLVTDPTQLIGISFNRYYAGCSQGGTSPATTTGNYLSIDGSGNADFTVTNNGATSNIAIPEATFTASLNGTPYTEDNAKAADVWYAYQYQTATGLTRYAIVEHRVPTAAQLGSVALWLQ